MDWLEDGIVEYIKTIYEGFFTSVTSLINEAMKTPSTFNKNIWNIVNEFHDNAVLPVAWSILSLFLLFELVKVIRKYNAQGMDLLYCVSMTVLKISLAKIIMENSLDIINILFQLGAYILSLGKSYINTSYGTNIDVTKLTDALDKSNIVSLVGLMISATIINLAKDICNILAFCVVRLRFIEIYAMTAVASLPMTTLPNEEYSSIGKNYLKRMAGLATHSIFIVIVLFIYSVLVSDVTFVGSSANALDGLLSGLGYSILMVIALFQTGGWAKSIWNAN